MPQSKPETIRKLREDNLILSALVKKAAGSKLTSAEAEVLAEMKKARDLEDRLSEQYDLGGAISKALRNRTSLLPGTSAAQAVADAYTPNTRKATEPEPTPEEQAQIDALVTRIRKVRGDIEQSGIPRRGTL